MEKQDKRRRRASLLAGLLILLLTPSYAQAPDEEEEEFVGYIPTVIYPDPTGLLDLQVRYPDKDPAEDTPYIMSVLVHHPAPEELQVTFPFLIGGLILERYRIIPRPLQRNGETWTEVEFRFLPRVAGECVIPPIEFTTPDASDATEAITLVVSGAGSRRAAQNRPRPYFRWIGAAPTLREGEAALLQLSLFNAQTYEISEKNFHIETSASFLIEDIKLEGQTVSFAVIPLKTGRLTLPRVVLEYPGGRVSAPALNAVSTAAAPETAAPDEAPPPEPAPAALPAFPAGEMQEAAAKALWDEGRYAQAIAEIRRLERDSITGFNLAALRAQAEESLGIENTPPEPWRPRLLFITGFYAFIFIFLLGLAGIFFEVCRRFGVLPSVLAVYGRLRPKGSRPVTLLLILAIAGAGASGFGLYLARPKDTGVALACGLYRVPEPDAHAAVRLVEGQPVRVTARSGDWLSVESYNGKSGWVEKEYIITY